MFGRRLSDKAENAGEKMFFRVAIGSDIDEICNIVQAAVSEMEKQGIYQWDDLYPTRDNFLSDIEKGQLFVGFVEKSIAVLFVVNQECEDEYSSGKWKYPNSEYRVIHRLCVNPTYQNQGIATKALAYIEEKLRKEKVETIRLDVFGKNFIALPMYLKKGYEEVGHVTWRKGEFFLMEKLIDRMLLS